MSMKGVTRVLAVLALLLSCAAGACAHAFLDRAAPAVGSAVRGSPAEVRLWFTQELEPAFSTIRVLDRNGNQVDKRDTRVDVSDRTLLHVSLVSLTAGTYKVVWRVVSIDTHVTEGDFTFEVLP